MKKFILLIAVVCLLPLAAQAAAARDITAETRFNMPQIKDSSVSYMRDRMPETSAHAAAYRDPYITVIPGDTPVAALRIDMGKNIMPFTVQVREGGEWQTIAASDGLYAQQYVEFAPQSGNFRVQFDSGDRARTLSIREIYCFSEGERDTELAHIWQPQAEKADLMFIATHPDDELLWFGGAIPYYAGELKKAVQVVYATCSADFRRIELLDGLWHCGVRTYPTIGDFEDFSDPDPKIILTAWGKDKILSYLVEEIRRCRPEVIVTQDAQGEYGHVQHIALVGCVREAVALAADGEYRPELGESWQAKKLYLHLGEGTTVMDWSRPLNRFNGRDGFEVAQEAFGYHKSQGADKYSVARPGEANDSTLFTLVFSAVGADTLGGDFLENVQ